MIGNINEHTYTDQEPSPEHSSAHPTKMLPVIARIPSAYIHRQYPSLELGEEVKLRQTSSQTHQVM